jgi:LysR family hydrogen peroxide-inducible transcriptional activator
MERPSLRQLECFVALADHLSFRRAARTCYITQPALSLQIRELETRIGAPLFERDRRHVMLTQVGASLLPRARAALADIDAFIDAAAIHRDPLAGTLRIGVIPTIAPYVLPSATAAIRRAAPKLRLLLHEEKTPRLVELLSSGRLDVGLLALEADLGHLATWPLYSDPFLLAVRSGHRLASRKLAREQDLSSAEVLLLEDGHCLRHQALAICHRAGAHEFGDFRASSLNTLVRMIASGLGITLLPAMAIQTEVHAQDRLILLPLERRHARTIGLAWRPTSPRSKTLTLLGEILRREAPPGTVPLDGQLPTAAPPGAR